MYEIDQKDRVRELAGVPPQCAGAPIPFVLSDGQRTVLAYHIAEPTPGWDGKSIRSMSPTTEGELLAVVTFALCYALMFGPPNDEAFSGHPLASRGLEPYGAFEVENSSWVRRLERMNSVHPHHRPLLYERLRHLIFTFHDGTFECVCDGFDHFLRRGSIESVVPMMLKQLKWRS